MDLNARHGQCCGQGENTTLGIPRAMETKMIDSSEDLTVGNTTLSTPRAMKIGMVLKWGLDCWKYNIMHHSKSNGDGIGGRRCRFNCRTERGSWTR